MTLDHPGDPVFGPIAGPYNVEVAVVATLKKWLWPTYLENVQAQAGLQVGTVPKPEMVYGVYDAEDFINERMPGVMVACTTPSGEPERFASVGYTQLYRLEIWSALRNDDRDTARRDAGLYAEAVMATVVQTLGGDHPNLISDVWMTDAPSVSLPNADRRLVYVGHVAFDVYIEPLVIDESGPSSPLAPGGTPPTPEIVEQINITITAEPID